MHINFDTETLKLAEARGLIAFLSNLFPAAEQFDFDWAPQDPAIAEAASQGSAGACLKASQVSVPARDTEDQSVQPEAPVAAGGPGSAAEPTPVNQQRSQEPLPTTRHRRTKAEIAADEAVAAKAQAAPVGHTSTAVVTDSAAPTAAASSTTQPAIVTPNTAPVSADELRALLNGYIAKHSMEEAIGQLQNFGCNRVTEALALEPVKLNALAEALRG